jgi:hypothetical protein
MWTKIDDKFPDHPKVVDAGPLAELLYVHGLCYANRYLTDGKIANRMANRMANDIAEGMQLLYGKSFAAQELIDRLLRSDLWERTEDGYQVHDFHDCNPTAEEAREKREAVTHARKEAGKRGAAARWQNGKRDGKNMAPNPNPNHKEEKKKNAGQARKRPASLPDGFSLPRLWQLMGVTFGKLTWSGADFARETQAVEIVTAAVPTATEQDIVNFLLYIRSCDSEWKSNGAGMPLLSRCKTDYGSWVNAGKPDAPTGGKRNGSTAGKPTVSEVLTDIFRPSATDEATDYRRLPAGREDVAYRRGA